MAITAQMVKELRERTGAGMMECKKALKEVDGNIEKAVENLRKAGQAKADKKASRTAAEGVIYIATSEDNKTAAMIDVNCETDFVARDEGFLSFVRDAAKTALANNITDVETLLNTNSSSNSEHTVEELRRNLIAKIGENINVRRVVMISSISGCVGSYVHGNRIGVIVELDGGVASLAKDIAMHIAAVNPMVVSPSQVSEDIINKEKEIFSAQAMQSGKPAEIIEKMITGRIKKFLDEISLEGQPFVKDPNTTVGKLLQSEGASVTSFTRYQVGEGIEKKQENFADEVMSQVKGS